MARDSGRWSKTALEVKGDRFNSYRAGWRAGASGGAQETSKSPSDWTAGYDAGRAAFTAAMKDAETRIALEDEELSELGKFALRRAGIETP